MDIAKLITAVAIALLWAYMWNIWAPRFGFVVYSWQYWAILCGVASLIGTLFGRLVP